MKVEFSKMHGLGNDFMVVDAIAHPFAPDAARVRALADRRTGVGFDQLLLVEAAPDGGVDFGYRVFNADGREVAQCGNGARCFARFVRARGLSASTMLRARTAERVVEMRVRADGLVCVDMGAPVFDAARVPFAGDAALDDFRVDVGGRRLRFGVVGFGNPHAVAEVEDLENCAVSEIGARLQGHASFPAGVNVGFMRRVDERRLELRVYERGVGETAACGSGACAAAVIAAARGLVGTCVAVRLPGGVLEVARRGEGVELTGPCAHVYDGVLAA